MIHRISQPRQNSSSRMGTAITLMAIRKSRNDRIVPGCRRRVAGGMSDDRRYRKEMMWCHQGAIRSGATQMTNTAIPIRMLEQRFRGAAAQRNQRHREDRRHRNDESKPGGNRNQLLQCQQPDEYQKGKERK